MQNLRALAGAVWTTTRRRRTAVVAAGFTLAVLAAAAGWAAGAGHVLKDADIRNAIQDRFLSDQGVPFHTVDVGVTDGIATLSGRVDTILARRRAVNLARAIKGVRAVVDRLTVEPVSRPDGALLSDIRSALLTDPAADSYQVKVAVSDGVATLTGKVDSWQEKQIVGRVAEGVEGVKQVRNLVRFGAPAVTSDKEMAAQIRDRLHWDAHVDDALIDVAVDRGTARLTGTVGSAIEKARAENLAWVRGVRAVDASGLDVEWWARNEMQRDKYAARTDAQIATAVKQAFLYDPRVLSFRPKVDVDGGIVTLNGSVDSLEARRAAANDARDTVGVIDVRNYLRVRPPTGTSGQTVMHDVEQALARDPILHRLAIGVTAFGGDVYLAGEVDSPFEKAHAETVAAAVKGVVDVRDDLRVLGQPAYRTDLAIQRAIEDEIYWSPFVDSDKVHVAVRDGVATLTGTVESWADYSAAAQDAKAGGALAVRNDLSVLGAKAAS